MPTQTPAIAPGRFVLDQIGPASEAFYREHGYLIVDDAFGEEEIAAINREAVAICRGQRGDFGKGWGTSPDVSGAADLGEEELLRRYLCIHHPQAGSPLIRETLAHPALVRVLTSVIGPNVKCMQSMLFIKASGKPGQAWHQDEDFIPTRDRSLAGAWIALDHATVENGCLWVLPGSHRPGILWPMYPHDDPRFDCAQMSYDFPYRDEEAAPVELRRGGVVFFNGYLLHRSLPNRAPGGFRRALVNHYMSAESLLPWGAAQPDGQPIAQYDNRAITMVAGVDPYAWKPATPAREMIIRPDGMGGCGDGRTSLEEYKRSRASN